MALKDYKPENVVISFGDSFSTSLPRKPKVPVRKHKLETDYKIAGRSFSDYVFRRLQKDGIGFYPQSTWETSATDLYSYITAPVPQNDSDFLAYCHELGHCKSRQYADSGAFYHASYSGGWGMERLVSEVNAWKWALRYFRRLGYDLKNETKGLVQKALNSYFANAQDYHVAKKLSDEFEIYSGISTNVKEPFHLKNKDFCFTTTFGNSWDGYFESIHPVKEKPQPAGHKPWHDLKQKQMKKSWKHQK